MELSFLTKRKKIRKIKEILDNYFDNAIFKALDEHYKLEEENTFLGSKSCINYVITLKMDDTLVYFKEKEFKIKIPKSTKLNEIGEKIRKEFKEQLFYNRNASQLVRYLVDFDEFYDDHQGLRIPRKLLTDALAETIVKFSKIKYCDDYDNADFYTIFVKEIMPRFLENKEKYFIPLEEGITTEVAIDELIDEFQDSLELVIEDLFGIYNFCLPTKPLL